MTPEASSLPDTDRRRVQPMPPCRPVPGVATGEFPGPGNVSSRLQPPLNFSILDKRLGHFPGAGNRETGGAGALTTSGPPRALPVVLPPEPGGTSVKISDTE